MMGMMIKMNKQEQFIELRRKYFWEQKTKEIGFALLVILFALLLIFCIGSIFLEFNPEGINHGSPENPEYSTNVFLIGMVISMYLTVFGVIIYFLGWLIWQMIKGWIDSNLLEAEERARRELNLK